MQSNYDVIVVRPLAAKDPCVARTQTANPYRCPPRQRRDAVGLLSRNQAPQSACSISANGLPLAKRQLIDPTRDMTVIRSRQRWIGYDEAANEMIRAEGKWLAYRHTQRKPGQRATSQTWVSTNALSQNWGCVSDWKV